MSAEPQNPAQVDCRTAEGRILARIRLWPTRDAGLTGETHPLVRWPEVEAQARGEEPVQLRERCRYVYRLEPLDGVTDLALREERGVTRNPAAMGGCDEGFIEPGDQCGVLPLVVMRGGDSAPLARAAVEVRSVKIDYRAHYRGMLDYIATKCAGLLLDSRAPTRLRLSSAWRTNRAAFEQQLEFLRHTLESPRFRGAVDEVLRNPHRRLEDEREERYISRPFKAGRDFARQVARAGNRMAVPPTHPLRLAQSRLASLPTSVTVTTRTDFLDTPENRFAKMVLVEFRDFLAEVGALLGRDPREAAKSENARLLREVARLRGLLDALLGRGFLPDIAHPETLPLGSPVLQRKAGYRELLHLWLQFHVGAQLAWAGGQEVWQGGARNVAILYEYWLFFQLEALFRARFACTDPLHTVLVENDAGLPRLKLQRGIELRTPIGGVWSHTAGRRLAAEFHFNRKFTRRRDHDHTRPGSWTRGVQPDYTISIWPADFTQEEAEKQEAMVHIHFDAKYRLDLARAVFGDDRDEEVIHDRAESQRETPTVAKYADLLKMHAYRDAIRRTAGAYVLYPGNGGDGKLFEEFEGFHEVLPGLGAFAIRPRLDGTAEGMDDLRRFLDDVIEHLANRTTARERVSYHVAESYALRENPVAYGSLILAEHDALGGDDRALPPAEHHVVVAWYETPTQLDWTRRTGLANVRLGDRPGSWRIPPEIASARHLLLRTHRGVVAPGLFRLRTPGCRVLTAGDLRHNGYPGTAGSEIYAVFDVSEDPTYAGLEWNGSVLMRVITEFEARMKHRPGLTLGRTSPYSRVLSLRELLKALKSADPTDDPFSGEM
ncbi:MAG: DUF2357 domain-containing protein [Candidatus Contendobacter sp.]|nr:DUF2357 domain-containing protein [Candidatus Contendobacter sp.]